MPFQGPPVGVTVPLGKKSVQITVGPTPPKKKRLPRLGATDICNKSQKAAITAAFADAATRIPIVRSMGGACETLADRLENLGINDLTITCDLCTGNQESSSDADFGTIQICSFPLVPVDLTRIILREQVRLAGGMPIDVWVVDTRVFFYSGGGVYSRGDSRAPAEMCAGSNPYYFLGVLTKVRVGNYVWWDPPSGELWTLAKVGMPMHTWSSLGSDSYLMYTCP